MAPDNEESQEDDGEEPPNAEDGDGSYQEEGDEEEAPDGSKALANQKAGGPGDAEM